VIGGFLFLSLAYHDGEDSGNPRGFPGGFSGDAANAFMASGKIPEQQQMFAWVTRVTALRRAHPAIAYGAMQVLASNDECMIP
jgi:hypothetical protein